jgi:outer membrane biosynthesis protein TonB
MGLKDLLEAANLEDELIEATNKAKEKKAPEKEEKNVAPKEEKEVKKAPKTEDKKTPKKEERAVVEKVVVKPKEEINKTVENKAEEKPVQNIHVQNTPSEVAPQMPAIPEIEPRKGMGRPKVYGKRQGINLQLNEENYIKARQWSGFYGSMTAYINALIENDTRPFPQVFTTNNEG